MSEIDGVMEDGDCFYTSVAQSFCLRAAHTTDEFRFPQLTVPMMRGWVAEEMGQDQLDFYHAMAAADTNEAWLDFLRKPSSQRKRAKRHRQVKRERGKSPKKRKVEKEAEKKAAPAPSASSSSSSSSLDFI
tara:strand:- start:125 stop:517 length:393 start_codon:yes stop_codon:yes gene_type:complete